MSDPMKMINDFFQQRPKRTLLDSIDQAFKKTTAASFTAEIAEDDLNFMINAELPGVPKNDISVELRGNQVVITVKEQKHPIRKIGGTRIVQIPDYVNNKKMKAVYRNGMLEIRLEKKKSTRIEIE
ncbi:Hsp20/alpha crystallin family protein [uncultured Metabacillus sp.]|uniref:Hsp20/alpha crystallin family protein n=1 Tax=uncultured Metabacillus sp. TaxID=2860135 RepID=UPI00261C925D|nr:Hsp20/alpha crystallin family protein [uncultured Metabacillus sp.]